MRRSMLIGAGVIAGGIIIGGVSAVGIAALLAHDAAPSTVGQLSLTPADRYHSRGIIPLEVDAEVGALEVYIVRPDASLHPPPEGIRDEVWTLMTRIMTPERAAAAITTYKVGDNPDSDRTAWVVAHQRHHDQWILGVNLANAEDRTALVATLIHEYGHLIAMREGQLVPASPHGCVTLLLPEGCALHGGYLHEFFRAFWEDYGAEAPNPANMSAVGAMHLYAAYPDAFVSEYAALNIVEDFAESFAAYVHTAGDIPAGAYAGKLAFFDRYAETAQIRDEIREQLDGTLGTLHAE